MARKGGLGKGLDALLPGGASVESHTSYVPIDSISPNPYQPRTTLHPEELENLAASIREHGILQPLIVTQNPQNGEFTLIAGERRLRAAEIAGLESVPVLVRQVNRQQMLELALIENLQRTDLTPLEAAEAYRQLAEDFHLSHDEIAFRVGKNRSTITNTLRLLKLPESVRTALNSNQITEGHARALLGLSSAQAQAAALQSILKNDLTVRQTEELVRKLGGEKPLRQTGKPISPEIQEIENRLMHNLGTKVAIHNGKKGGTIVIRYYSDEELNNLIEQIIKE
jgi:ParB family transcriptional regulator, chromosome partitioning protein